MDATDRARGLRPAAARGGSSRWLAGAVSFASPCVVPLVPGYLAYLAGLVGADAAPLGGRGDGTPGVAGRRGGGAVRRRVHGRVRRDPRRRRVARRRAGRQRGAAAARRRRRHHRDGAGVRRARPRPAARAPACTGCRARGVWGAPLLGAVFGLGWTPCLGPTLAGVVAVAGGHGRRVAARRPARAGLLRRASGCRSCSSRSARRARCGRWPGCAATRRGDPDRRRRAAGRRSGSRWSPACGTGWLALLQASVGGFAPVI